MDCSSFTHETINFIFMENSKFNFETNRPFSHRKGNRNGVTEGTDFLDDGIGLILTAHTDINPDGSVIAPDNSLVKAINLGLPIAAGDKVIIVRSIESVGWEVELYLSEDKWEEGDMI